jgi:hypothetical protein
MVGIESEVFSHRQSRRKDITQGRQKLSEVKTSTTRPSAVFHDNCVTAETKGKSRIASPESVVLSEGAVLLETTAA